MKKSEIVTTIDSLVRGIENILNKLGILTNINISGSCQNVPVFMVRKLSSVTKKEIEATDSFFIHIYLKDETVIAHNIPCKSVESIEKHIMSLMTTIVTIWTKEQLFPPLESEN